MKGHGVQPRTRGAAVTQIRREKRLRRLRTRTADFKSLNTLEDFDWRFNSTVSRKDIYAHGGSASLGEPHPAPRKTQVSGGFISWMVV